MKILVCMLCCFSGGRDRLEPVGGGGGGLSLYICNYKEEGAEREPAGGGKTVIFVF